MLKVYLTNLGKYNEGELCGKWCTLPMDEEQTAEALEQIGIGPGYDEYFITDYESDVDGLRIGEYDNLEELDELAEELDALQDYEIGIVEALLSDGYDIREALEKRDDCILWDGCSSMADVAERYADETGLLESIPENLRYYFDFAALGRDMKLEGHFIEYGGGYVEVVG